MPRRSMTVTRHGLLACAALFLLVVSTTRARGQGLTAAEAFWFFPEKFVAYWAMDPSALGDEDARVKAAAAAAMRGLVAHTVNIEGGSSVADALLRPNLLGDSAYRVCLLELEGETTVPKDKKAATVVKPAKFAAVIEIRKPAKDGGHDRLAGAMEGALAADAKADGKPRDRKKVVLPTGVSAEVSAAGEDEWRELAWASLPDMFVVGIGHGSVERWVSGRATAGKSTAWVAQRNEIATKRGKGTRVFEAFVDLNALRQGVPEEFLKGRLGPLTEAWHIAADRTYMVHGTLMDGGAKAERTGLALLALDLSWSERAEKPGAWKSVALSEGKWPEGVSGLEKPSSGWAMLTRASVPTWITLGADTYESLGGGQEFSTIRTRWERRMLPVIEKLSPRLGEWVMVRPDSVVVQVKPASGQDRLAADLRGLFSSMEPVVGFAGKSWMLKADGDDALEGLSWRVSDDGKSIVGGWGAEKGKPKK